MPLPIMSLSRITHASPVPAQTVLRPEGATAIAPIACADWPPKLGAQRLPLSVVFQTPPAAPPTEYAVFSLGTPATDAIRFPTAGPTKRNARFSWTGAPNPRR